LSLLKGLDAQEDPRYQKDDDGDVSHAVQLYGNVETDDLKLLQDDDASRALVLSFGGLIETTYFAAVDDGQGDFVT